MRRSLGILIVAVGVAMASCGGGDETQPPAAANAIGVAMTDYAFAFSGRARPGPLTLTFRNDGREFHNAIAGRIDEGKTLEDVTAFLSQEDEGPPPEWLHDDPGDLPILSPGQEFGLTIDASAPGTYVLICFIPAASGQPHFALGMVNTFRVEGAPAPDAPASTATFTFDPDAVTAPALPAGATTVEIRNEGDSPADFNVVRLEEGKVLEDADAWFENQEGPPPATFFGGTHGVEAGKPVTLTLHLDPGTYLAVATYEEPEQKDVVAEFTVS